MKFISLFILSVFYLTASFGQSAFMQGLQAFEGDVGVAPNDQVAAEQFEKAFMENNNLLAGLYLQHMMDKKLLVIPLKSAVLDKVGLLKALNLSTYLNDHGGLQARDFFNSLRTGNVKVTKKYAIVYQDARGGRTLCAQARITAEAPLGSKAKLDALDGTEKSGLESSVHFIVKKNMSIVPEYIKDFNKGLKSERNYDSTSEIGVMKVLCDYLKDKEINTDGVTEYTLGNLLLDPECSFSVSKGCTELKQHLSQSLLRHAALLGHPKALKNFLFEAVLNSETPEWCVMHMVCKVFDFENDDKIEHEHAKKRHSLVPLSTAVKALRLLPEDDEDIKTFALIALCSDRMHDYLLPSNVSTQSVSQAGSGLALFIPRLEALLEQPLHPQLIKMIRFLSACYRSKLRENNAYKVLKSHLASLKFDPTNTSPMYVFAVFLEALAEFELKEKGLLKEVTPVARSVLHWCKNQRHIDFKDMKCVASLAIFVDEAPLYGPLTEERAKKLWDLVSEVIGELEHPKYFVPIGNILRQYPSFTRPKVCNDVTIKLMNFYQFYLTKDACVIQADPLLNAQSTFAPLTETEAENKITEGYDPTLDYFVDAKDNGKTVVSRPKIEHQVGRCLEILNPCVRIRILKQLFLEMGVHVKDTDTLNNAYVILAQYLGSKGCANRDLLYKYAEIFGQKNEIHEAFMLLQYIWLRFSDWPACAQLFRMVNSEKNKKQLLTECLSEEDFNTVKSNLLTCIATVSPFWGALLHLENVLELEVTDEDVLSEETHEGYFRKEASLADRYALSIVLDEAEKNGLAGLILYEMLSGSFPSLLVTDTVLAGVHLSKAAELGSSEAKVILGRAEWKKRSKEIEEQIKRNETKRKTVGSKNNENAVLNQSASSSTSTSQEKSKVEVALSGRELETWDSLLGNDNVKIADLKRFLGTLGEIKTGSGSRIKVQVGHARIHYHDQHNDLHGTTLEKGRQKSIVQQIQQQIEVVELPKN